jgi:hypothetical protein
MQQNDIILADINGQYEFAHIHYLRDDAKYIAITTLSGRVMGGPLTSDDRGQILHLDNETILLNRAGTFVPGYAAACEHFGY